MLDPGNVVDRKYLLEQPIGVGGMGRVWRARHVDLERPVAIKFLELQGSDVESQVKRFMREAKVAASVRDRHVVDILDVGATAEGQPYMVMEMLEGESLAERIDDGVPLPVGESCRIIASCLRGLAAVHAAGIVHRDLKPDNIFLVRAPEGILPKLVDFGISRMLVHRPGVTFVTRTGMILGTPHYMSPEQARGAKDCDQRADLYSMGVILYEALTSRLPFEADNVGDLLTKIWTEEPIALEARRPDLTGLLAEWVRIALARKPEDRFQTANDMRNALDAVLPTLSDLPPPVRMTRAPKESTLNAALAETTGSISGTTNRRLDGGATGPAPPPKSIEPVPRDRAQTVDGMTAVPTDTGTLSNARAPGALPPSRDRVTTNVDGMLFTLPADPLAATQAVESPARERTATTVDGMQAIHDADEKTAAREFDLGALGQGVEVERTTPGSADEVEKTTASEVDIDAIEAQLAARNQPPTSPPADVVAPHFVARAYHKQKYDSIPTETIQGLRKRRTSWQWWLSIAFLGVALAAFAYVVLRAGGELAPVEAPTAPLGASKPPVVAVPRAVPGAAPALSEPTTLPAARAVPASASGGSPADTKRTPFKTPRSKRPTKLLDPWAQ